MSRGHPLRRTPPPAELLPWLEGLDGSRDRLRRFVRASLAAGRSPASTLGLAAELNSRLVAPLPPEAVVAVFMTVPSAPR